MNTVLEYAVQHQEGARCALLGLYRIPYDDLEDVVQSMVVSILQAAPRDVEKPSAYWWRVLHSAAHTYWRYRQVRRGTLPLADYDCTDPRQQDPETLAIQREGLREALATVRPSEREAVIEYALGLPKSNASRTAMCRLRRRLQAA